MATTNVVRMKIEQLLQELGIWRSVIIPSSNLFDKDLFLRDFLAFKIDIAQGFIEESYKWEKSGNETKRKNAVDNAEVYLGEIQALFDGMFVDQETWPESEEERNSPYYIDMS